MSNEPQPLTPGTVRLLHRLTQVLAVLAGAFFVVAFILGIVREGAVRWVVLMLGLTFLSSPIILTRLMPPP